LFGGCSSTLSKSLTPTSSVSVHGASLVYCGAISHEANAQLFDLHRGVGNETSQLLITSTGGDVDAGIELGLWVHDNGLDVGIPEYGQEERFDCRHGNATFIGWYYSVDDLHRLGVRNVSIAGGEWRPKLPVADAKICQVSLDTSERGQSEKGSE
jgi:hypothetical protein